MTIIDPNPSRLPGRVWLTVGAVVVLLLSTSGRYGFHRDELYFLVAGRRLDWGFVDQPPLTPLIANAAEQFAGTSPVALRVLPAVAIGGVVILAAAMAKRFGGSTKSRVYAGVTAGGAGVALAMGHLLSTAAFDYFLWTLAAWMLVRLLDGDDPRWWLGLGLAVGVGLQNKHLIGLLALAVLISLLASSRRSLLGGKWPWIGAGTAALIAVPNLIWQIGNDLPQLEMARSLAGRSDGPVAFVLQQIGLLSIVLAVPAAVGLWRLLRADDLQRWRPIGLAFVLLFVFFLLTGGKAYYVAPMYPALLAAGSLWFERLEGRRRKIMIGATAAGIFIGLFIALPLLPPSDMSVLDATGELGETVGWPELIDQVVAVYEMIPVDQRADVAIFTGSYGEAGAVDVLGPEVGLPPATSGHNNYWLWGPPGHHGPIIGVGQIGDVLAGICPTTVQAGTITNPYGVENEEAGLPLFLCLAPEGQLADIWDQVRHYN
ncbi:MAG: glycosyltransferase family 39 protein [Acidimicrobiia bacterium]|nr:glycosyltransferase family 39 protein [Acidimicrobiia bacterium]